MITISVAARQSELSKRQVNEILTELSQHHAVEFIPNYFLTSGDKDLKTSLRLLDKTNFFTKEIDDIILQGKCRVAIHSAKDLPEPLPEGLAVFAFTKGLDCSDSLVLRENETLDSLPKHAIVATSSARREELVKQYRPDFTFVDIRGTIQQRLEKVMTKEVDGVVIAEAALIRLNLTHLNRIKLKGDTTPMQGRLAVIGQEKDEEMKQLFACLHYDN
ncbi:MAG: hydroxymethylbilane synthase [Chlamydia sp. 32-24]|nr:MAG: hydroxymethylbilane synthase [Chlamydia sp. 32-24]